MGKQKIIICDGFYDFYFDVAIPIKKVRNQKGAEKIIKKEFPKYEIENIEITYLRFIGETCNFGTYECPEKAPVGHYKRFEEGGRGAMPCYYFHIKLNEKDLCESFKEQDLRMLEFLEEEFI